MHCLMIRNGTQKLLKVRLHERNEFKRCEKRLWDLKVKYQRTILISYFLKALAMRMMHMIVDQLVELVLRFSQLHMMTMKLGQRQDHRKSSLEQCQDKTTLWETILWSPTLAKRLINERKSKYYLLRKKISLIITMIPCQLSREIRVRKEHFWDENKDRSMTLKWLSKNLGKKWKNEKRKKKNWSKKCLKKCKRRTENDRSNIWSNLSF